MLVGVEPRHFGRPHPYFPLDEPRGAKGHKAGDEAVAEWKARRQMAERAGVGFEVKAKVDAGGGGSGAKGGSFAGCFAKAFNLPRNTK